MPALAQSTDELRAELCERVRELKGLLKDLDGEIRHTERFLLDLAEDRTTPPAEKVRAVNATNRSLHDRADAARKELAAALRLLRVELPTPMEPAAFAEAAAAGRIAGISDLDRARLYSGRPGLDDVGDATLSALSDEELEDRRRAWYADGGRP